MAIKKRSVTVLSQNLCERHNDLLQSSSVARRSNPVGKQPLLQVRHALPEHDQACRHSNTHQSHPIALRINLPKRKRRERLKEMERDSPRESFVEVDMETASEASSEQDYSYEFAQMEVMMKTLGSNGTAVTFDLTRCST